MDYDEVCDLDLDEVKIGELDLGALARAFRVIGFYFSGAGADKTGNEDGKRDREGLEWLFFDYITHEGAYMIERQLAFRMVFEVSLQAPAYMRMVEKIIGPRTELENEYEEETQRTKFAAN